MFSKLSQKRFEFHTKEQKCQNFKFGLTIFFQVQVDIAKNVLVRYKHVIFENKLMCGFKVIPENILVPQETEKVSKFRHDFFLLLKVQVDIAQRFHRTICMDKACKNW